MTEQKSRGWNYRGQSKEGKRKGRANNYAAWVKRCLSRKRRRLGKADPDAPVKKLTKGYE